MYCTNTAEILRKRETAVDAELRRGLLPRASEDIPLRARCLSGFGGILSGEEGRVGGIDDSRKWRRKRILREWGWKEGGAVVVCPESLRSKRNHSATETADTQPLPLNYAYHTADRAESKLQSIAPSPSSCSSLFRRKNCLGRPLLTVVSSPPFHNAAAEKPIRQLFCCCCLSFFCRCHWSCTL